MNNVIEVSSLNKTWILDLDGTIVKHNGYKMDGQDSFLEGAQDFLRSISQEDMIIFITSRREEECKEMTETFLKRHQIRYNAIIWNAPYGERILINDKKESGLVTAIALNTKRDEMFKEQFKANEKL